MKMVAAAIASTIIVATLSVTTSSAVGAPCSSDVEDFSTHVSGISDCLGLKTVPGLDPNDGRLLVYVHGDNPSTRNSDRPFDQLMTQANAVPDLNNFTRIAIARPGHNFSTGVSSSGNECTKDICYSESNFKEIGTAITKLKRHYNARSVIMIGRSGGGNTVASIAGLFPGIANEVVGIAGNYDFEKWVQTSSIMKPNWVIFPSPSAKKYVQGIDKGTFVTLVHGLDDTNNRRPISEGYLELLKQHDIQAELYDVPTGHFDQEKSPALAPVLQSILSRAKQAAASKAQ